jgi:DNA-binding MarR family transcriptional regulator
MIRLLSVAASQFEDEFTDKLAAVGLGDLRPGHGCVFGNIDPEGGCRLTELAERAHMTKQSVGEFASDLEQLGYLERVPDPDDGRAKIIRLTDLGRRAYWIGHQLIDELEREWAERYGEERIAALREGLEFLTAGGLGGVRTVQNSATRTTPQSIATSTKPSP